MQVLEIKNNLVKIAYEVRDNVIISGFLLIEDESLCYIGQVVGLRADLDANYAMVKLLFTSGRDGVLKAYNGSIPSLRSSVSVLSVHELLDIIPVETPFVIGKLAQQDVVLRIDRAIFENNLVICSNRNQDTDFLLRNFAIEFDKEDKSALFIDTTGDMSLEGKLVFGRDFKLPLNSEMINFISEHNLNDVDSPSRAVMQEVLLEVQEYADTLPGGFIPFNRFMEVIDAQYKSTGISGLLLLRNKLLRYKNFFANRAEEIAVLGMYLREYNIAVIDVSDAEAGLQRKLIGYVYDAAMEINPGIYSFIGLNNENGTKKLLKKLGEYPAVTIICGHEYKYLRDLKNYAGNLILFAPPTHQHDFADYNNFLNKLNTGEFVIYGNYTQNIPLIVKLDDIENIEEEFPVQAELPDFEEEIMPVEEPAMEQTWEPAEEISEQEETFFEEDEFIEEADEEEFYPESESSLEQIEQEYEQNTELNYIAEPGVTAGVTDFAQEFEQEEEPDFTGGFEQTFEEESFAQNFPQADLSSEELIEEAADEVMQEPFSDIMNETLEAPEEEIEEEYEMPEVMETPEEPEGVSPVPQKWEPPKSDIPLYPANDINPKNAPVFEQGSAVSHPKYGSGVVEKIVKYGNKTLCSINFEGVGRRLLDPAISDITAG